MNKLGLVSAKNFYHLYLEQTRKKANLYFMIELRKSPFKPIDVYCGTVHIGVIENEAELHMFRADIIGLSDGDEYFLKLQDDSIIKLDRWGNYPPSFELEPSYHVISEILDKQMKLRARDKELRVNSANK